jgi:hypothetical protein
LATARPLHKNNPSTNHLFVFVFIFFLVSRCVTSLNAALTQHKTALRVVTYCSEHVVAHFEHHRGVDAVWPALRSVWGISPGIRGKKRGRGGEAYKRIFDILCKAAGRAQPTEERREGKPTVSTGNTFMHARVRWRAGGTLNLVQREQEGTKVAVEEERSEKTKNGEHQSSGRRLRYLVNTEMKTPAHRPLLSLYQAN